eukprot:CAMPEP_0177655300 /NCGR_PEP_ID=MMETSP0447-20121125/14876_1 /TAXON_ID=0 /ORGANISM="Stygamoeba regulata, Strain BSH-02190019" /LENGTH=191 /DNA_ID=CAMNT_0019159175 /DNA_START=102 /DNA_END=674 /DNA_ORIENTATION=-
MGNSSQKEATEVCARRRNSLEIVEHSDPGVDLEKLRDFFVTKVGDLDGEMDYETFKECLPSDGPDTDEKHTRFMFRIFDEDHNGGISWLEFVSANYLLSSCATYEEKMKFAFQTYDIDRNGAISRNELLEMVNVILQGAGLSDEEAESMQKTVLHNIFEKMDSNGDNEVSYEEFQKFLVDNPEAKDVLWGW